MHNDGAIAMGRDALCRAPALLPGLYGCYTLWMRWKSPIAYMLTWTTYGTWLHGDERGSWNRKATAVQEHFIPPNFRLEQYRKDLLKFPQLLLDGPMRRVVREAIEDQCEFDGWDLLALNVRTNHVHAVLPTDADSGHTMQRLKSRATRWLREQGLIERDRPAWTRGGSATLLFSNRHIEAAIEYVKHQQGPPLRED
jgi:REP element-mobilizing transposase RayT